MKLFDFAFCHEYEKKIQNLSGICPEKWSFGSNSDKVPSDLVFDTNCNIVPQYPHIFGDAENFLRIPKSVRESQNKTLLFDGAIKRAKHMIDANYKTAVPQYYRACELKVFNKKNNPSI